jgi:DNA polymerase III delta prime subunit
MTKVLLFEGIPGSGKTTLAKKTKEYLEKKGYDVTIFHEGDIHPIDLAWCSYMDKDTFSECVDQFPHLQEDILKHTDIKDNQYITAYTKVKIRDRKDVAFYQLFSRHEIYKFDNLDTFKNIHRKLYRYFNTHHDNKTIYIFECVLLQNHLNELILRYNKSFDYCVNYFNTLLDELNQVDLKIIHLQQKDVHRDISKIIAERTPETMNIPKNWVDLVVDYLDRQPYSKKLGYQGVKGVYKYYENRQEIEKKLLPMLHTTVYPIEVDQNYDDVFKQIIHNLELN